MQYQLEYGEPTNNSYCICLCSRLSPASPFQAPVCAGLSVIPWHCFEKRWFEIYVPHEGIWSFRTWSCCSFFWKTYAHTYRHTSLSVMHSANFKKTSCIHTPENRCILSFQAVRYEHLKNKLLFCNTCHHHLLLKMCKTSIALI